jgi:succinate dehydrogenase / fumarate reductase iron-sulfur subunit
MAGQAREEGFGHCTTIGECAAVCPAGIQLEVISRMNRDFIKATFSAGEALAPLTALPRTAALRDYEARPGTGQEAAVGAPPPTGERPG